MNDDRGDGAKVEVLNFEQSFESPAPDSALAVSEGFNRLEQVAVLNAVRVRHKRQVLLDSGVVTVAELAIGRKSERRMARQWLRRAIESHELLSISIANRTLVPSVLLDKGFDPVPAWQPVLETLARAGEGSWGAWAWIVTETTWLDGQRPVDIIDESAGLVVQAAEARRRALAGSGVS